MAAQAAHARVPAPALSLLGDDRLFRLAAEGDTRAFEAIYERHHQALYRYCRSIVGNSEDAADALQGAMASALRAIAGEQRQIPLRPWLFRIAHNESVSILRKRRSHASIETAAELEAPAQDPAVRQRLKELVADLRELPDAQRGALVMHELSGLRYREIAAALDVTEAHARQLVYEARSALQDLSEGRALECDVVRRTISDADRRVLRGRRIRAHLRACSDCAGFHQLMRTRKRDLAAIAPPVPAALAAGLLHSVLGGSSGTGGPASLVTGKALAVSAAAKTAAVVAVSAVAGVGALEIAHKGPLMHPAPAPAPAVHSGAPAAVKAIAVPAPAAAPHGQLAPSSGAGHRGARRRDAHSKGAHGKAPAAAPGKQTSPTRPAQAAQPAHPVHPAHPAHPTHPRHPAHPSHPANPGQSKGNGNTKTPHIPKSQQPAAAEPPAVAPVVPALPEGKKDHTPPGKAAALLF